MHYFFKLSIFIFTVTLSFSEGLFYNTQSDIHGFQFTVTDAEILNAYGGAAEEAGFHISFNAETGIIVAFSMTGNPIPAGQGSLINIDYNDNDNPCIQDLIISGIDGASIIPDMINCSSFVEICHGVSDCNINNVSYTTDSDIYGFQFETNEGEIVDAYGGAAEEAGFHISFNSETGIIVAFSMTGNPIPAGQGTLVKIEYINDLCLNELVLSGVDGINIDSYISECLSIVEGCENIDDCGICDGNGDSCVDCNQLFNLECEGNPYCYWFSDTVSCSGLSSSQCNAADGCSWTSGGGGPYGGGSSYCSGGSGQINGACFELSCNNLSQNECETDSECMWISDNSGGYGNEATNYCTDIEIYGCTNIYADNYNPNANINDESCVFSPLGTLSFHNYDYINKTLDVHMDCEFDVSNFEFTIEGLDISGFYGGTSGNLDFQVELDGSTIIGSSSSTDNIPANSGLLMTLNFDNNSNSICFENSSITTYIGITYEAVLESCVTPGCTDLIGCNYDVDASDDNGTCSYPYCDGSCDSEATIDECGICGGNGIPEWACDCNNNVLDCYGVCGGGIIIDECGICDGLNTDCCPGDLNDDDIMDVVDIIIIIDNVLTEDNYPNYNVLCSDFNNDNMLSIFDIIIMIDIILNEDS